MRQKYEWYSGKRYFISLPEDISVTEQLVEAGKVLDIELVDHLIIGSHQYISLKEQLRW